MNTHFQSGCLENQLARCDICSLVTTGDKAKAICIPGAGVSGGGARSVFSMVDDVGRITTYSGMNFIKEGRGGRRGAEAAGYHKSQIRPCHNVWRPYVLPDLPFVPLVNKTFCHLTDSPTTTTGCAGCILKRIRKMKTKPIWHI